MTGPQVGAVCRFSEPVFLESREQTWIGTSMKKVFILPAEMAEKKPEFVVVERTPHTCVVRVKDDYRQAYGFSTSTKFGTSWIHMGRFTFKVGRDLLKKLEELK